MVIVVERLKQILETVNAKTAHCYSLGAMHATHQCVLIARTAHHTYMKMGAHADYATEPMMFKTAQEICHAP